MPRSDDLSLETLLQQIADGDQTALETFYERTADTLYGVAMKVLRSNADADDALQQAFLHIFEKAGAYQPDLGCAMAWVVRITRNCAIDCIRSRQRQASTTQEFTRFMDVANGSSEVSGNGTAEPGALDEIARVLARLSDAERVAVEMAFFHGLNHAEIAQRLDCPTGTVKARIRRGMAKIRDPLLALRSEMLGG